MKTTIIIFTLLFQSVFLFGQEKEDLFILEADSTWYKEIFHFPLGFAQEINYEGIEDARFPVGWGKKDSATFWSYVFAWSINSSEELSENDLEINLQYYFDGLMGMSENGSEETGILNTTALILKLDETKGVTTYAGKVVTFDAFSAKKPMTLNVRIESKYCEKQKKSLIIFRFSPKSFESDVWLKLGEVKLRGNACDY